MSSRSRSLFLLVAIFVAFATASVAGGTLRRGPVVKPTYTSIGEHLNGGMMVVKLREEITLPTFVAGQYASDTPEWELLNEAFAEAVAGKPEQMQPLFKRRKDDLQQERQLASSQSGVALPDLSRYLELTLAASLAEQDKLELVERFNSSPLVEIAYFPAHPSLPVAESQSATPNWQAQQNYLDAAPAGVNAYYAWDYPGGKGAGVKVVDIEGNWVEHHEDLRGGTSTFHIAGSKIISPTWWEHGTAVLGQIAADSNGFGMTGIAYEVDLGTVSVGSMSIADGLNTAVANTVAGDVILFELQIGGPNGGAYVPVEYEQATFDAILVATAAGRIVVEAGANGGQNLDDAFFYGDLFDSTFRYSGAILVGAANQSHAPEGFSSYGSRVDVHGYGSEIYTLGYGDLFGSDTTDFYTQSFGGTSGASPIIVGSCAVLQGIHKAVHGTVLNHTEMRELLRNHSTPQAPSSRHIGPMPNLEGSVDEIVGVSFVGDTIFGWAPLPVQFSATSGLAVTSWAWDFGDGDSATVQNPSHTYIDNGIYDVTVQVDASGDIRSRTRTDYVVALADTIWAANVQGGAGDLVEVVVTGNNTVPATSFKVAVDMTGALGAALESYTTVGTRAAAMGEPTLSFFISADTRLTLRVNSTTPLPPGEGPIMRLYYRLPVGAASGQTTTISYDGFLSQISEFAGSYPTYEPASRSTIISVCSARGDVNNSGGVTVADLTFMINFLFNGGPPPVVSGSGDVNCSGNTTVGDLTYMVNYLFNGGPEPCSCP